MSPIHSSLFYKNGILNLNINTQPLQQIYIRFDMTMNQLLNVKRTSESDYEYTLCSKQFDAKNEYFIVNQPDTKYKKHLSKTYISHTLTPYQENETTYYLHLLNIVMPFIISMHKCKFIVTFMDTIKCNLIYHKESKLYYINIPHYFYKIILSCEQKYEKKREEELKVEKYLKSIENNNKLAEKKMEEFNKKTNLKSILKSETKNVPNDSVKKKKKKKKSRKRSNVTVCESKGSDDIDYLDSVIESQQNKINSMNVNDINEIFISWRHQVKQKKYITSFYIGKPVYLDTLNIWHNIIICFRYLKFNIGTLDIIYCMADKFLPLTNNIFNKSKVQFCKESRTFQSMITKINDSYEFFEKNIANLLTKITPTLNTVINNKFKLECDFSDDNVNALQIIIIFIKLLQMPEYNQLLINIKKFQREYNFSNTLYLLYSYGKYINYRVLTKNNVIITFILDQLVYHINYITTMISTKLANIMESNSKYLDVFSKIHYFKDPQKQYNYIEENIDLDNYNHICTSTLKFTNCYILWRKCYPIFNNLDYLQIHNELHYQIAFENKLLSIIKDIKIEKHLTRRLYLSSINEYKMCNPFLYLYEKKIINKDVTDYQKDLYMLVINMYINTSVSQHAYIIKQKINNTCIESSKLFKKSCIQNGFPLDLELQLDVCNKVDLYQKINEVCTMIRYGYIEYYDVLFNQIIINCIHVSDLIYILKCLAFGSIEIKNDLLEYITCNYLLEYIDILQKYRNRKSTLYETMDKLKFYCESHEKHGGLLLIDNIELLDLSAYLPFKIGGYLIGCITHKSNKDNISYLYSYVWKKINKNNKVLSSILEFIGICHDDISEMSKFIDSIPDKPNKELYTEYILTNEYVKRCT